MRAFVRGTLLLAVAGLLWGCEGGSVEPQGGEPEEAQGHDTQILTQARQTARRPAQRPLDDALAQSRRDTTGTSTRVPSGPVVHVTGRVTKAGGAPASGSVVELLTWNNAWIKRAATTVNAKGGYLLEGADEGQLYVRVTGEHPQIQETLASADSPSTEGRVRRLQVNFELPVSAQVEGLVVNERDEPVAGAPVYLRPNHVNDDKRAMETRETTSSGSGAFSFDHLAAGRWLLGATVPGYAPTIEWLKLPTSVPVVLKLTRGASVQGRVLHAETSQTVAGMTVVLSSAFADQIKEIETQQVVTGLDGAFRFDNVSTNPRSMRLMRNEQLGLAQTPPLPKTFRLEDGETTDITMYAYRGHVVSGTVYDKDTSEPLAGALVTANAGHVIINDPTDNKRTATTDESGRFRIDRIFTDGGSINLKTELKDYRQANDSVYDDGISLSPPKKLNEMDVELAMERQVRISGRLQTGRGDAVSGANVWFAEKGYYLDWPGFKRTATEADGSFHVVARPFKQGVIRAEAAGYGTTESETLTVEVKDIIGVKLVVAPSAAVHGTVLLPDGSAAAGARLVDVNDTSGRIMGASTTDANGVFSILNAPASMDIKAIKEGYAPSRALHLSLSSGEVRSGVELQLRDAKTIAGRVVNEKGEPVKANVSARGAVQEFVESKRDGTFVIEGLSAGRYTVEAAAEDKAWAIARSVIVGTMDLELVVKPQPQVKLLGTVVDDATEAPVADFRIIIPNDRPLTRLPDAGKFELILSAGASLPLAIKSPAYPIQYFNVNVPRDKETFEQTFQLGHDGVITGQVVDADTGKGLPGVTVTNWGSTPEWQRQSSRPCCFTITGRNGTYTLAPSPTGTNEVLFSPPSDFERHAERVQVRSGATQDMGNVKLRKVVTGP